MADRGLVEVLLERRFQAVIVILAGDEGVAGIIQDVEDGILILANFAGTGTYVVIDKITELRFACTPTTPFTATATALTVNLGFEEFVGSQLEAYRRLLVGTSAGDLVGTIGIVQNASVTAAPPPVLTPQVGYQSATITLTGGVGFFGNFLLVSFVGLLAAESPNFTGVFYILRGVGDFAGVVGGGRFSGDLFGAGGFIGTLSGIICPPPPFGA